MGKTNCGVGAPARVEPRGRRTLPGFLAISLGLAIVSASSAAEVSAADKVTIVGPSERPLIVKFVHQENEGWQGRLDLIVQNESRRRARLRLRFFPEGASQAPFVGIGPRFAGKGILVRRTFPAASRAVVLAGRRTLVSLDYRVTEATPLRKASGTVVVELVPAKAKAVEPFVHGRSLASTFVQIKASPAAQATFVPAPVKMAVERRVPFRSVGGTTVKVALRGEGLNELASGFPGVVASTLLFNDSGETTRATIRDLHATGDDEAEATVALDEIAGSGTYKGKFPPLRGAQGTQLEMAVDVHDWFLGAFVAVLVGAVLGWFFTHFAGSLRQKDMMRATLISRIQAYEDAVRANPGKPASFDLSEQLGPSPRYGPGVRCEPFPSDRTARDLLCRIASARSEDDFKDDQKRVAWFVDAIESWLEIEPRALRLRALRESPPPDRGSKEFLETSVAAQAGDLLLRQRRCRRTAMRQVV